MTCPRCGKPLPPLDVSECAKGCGTWVSQFASTEVLTVTDRKPDPVTRWWRVRAPCPICSEQMKLCGEKPGLLQGCELHGYFIDADSVNDTGLAGGVDQAKLERKRNDTGRIEAERAALEAAREEEEARKMEISRREAELDDRIKASEPDFTPSGARSKLGRIAMLTASGVGVLAANHIIGLEDRIERLEARIAELERQPKS